MSRASPRKGHRFEREVATALGGWLGVKLKRRGSWAKGSDLVPVDPRESIAFAVEVKAVEALNLETTIRDGFKTALGRAIAQCWTNARTEGKTPLLIAKRSHKPPMAFFEASLSGPRRAVVILSDPPSGDVPRRWAVTTFADVLESDPTEFTRRGAA